MVFLTLDNLDAKQSESLKRICDKFPDAAAEDLLGFLKYRKFDVEEASVQYLSSLEWRESVQPTIANIAPFLRRAPNAAGPDGCVVLLEDKKGGCARDKHGRPVIASIGMQHGSLSEMQAQTAYVFRRAERYCKPGAIRSFCIVIEVTPRDGANTTFRFPDAKVKACMDQQKHHFPGSLSTTTVFCGVPSPFVWAFSLCKPFMDPESYDSMVLLPNFNRLADHLPPESMLREWGGTLDFNIEGNQHIPDILFNIS